MARKTYPFKFLDAYGKEDQRIFFGREQEVDELYRLVFQTNLLLVYGPSGAGKTSLIRCGLANRLKSTQWLDLYVRRGADINQSLLDAIVQRTPETVSAGPAEGELDWFESMLEEEKGEASRAASPEDFVSDDPIAQALQKLYLATFTPIYLIFDQFEELFTLGNAGEQEQFTRTIETLVQLPLPVKIIFAMREEYLARLYKLEKAVPQLRNKKLRLEPMDLPRVEQVILSATVRNPDSNITLQQGQEAAIATAIVDKIREGDVDIQLPYLQVFMDRLYETASGEPIARDKEVRFGLDLVEQMGSIGDELAGFIERQSKRIHGALYQKFPGLSIDTIWQVLSPFATVDGTKIPIRQEAVMEIQQKLELPGGHSSAEFLKEAIAELESSRILRYRKTEDTYEVAHDTLALQIAEKRSEDEKAYLKARRIVTEGFAIYRDTNALLSREQLAFIKPYEVRLQEEINPEQQTFIRNSRNRRLRNRIYLGTAIALAFVAAILVIVWINAERQNTESQRQIAEEALVLADQNLRKAQSEEARATAALGQVKKEKAATDEQRRIAEENFKLAQAATKQAEADRDNAETALDNLGKSNAEVVKLILKNADREVLNLKYESALTIIQSAAKLQAAKEEVVKSWLEIAFWHAETGDSLRAAALLASIADFAGIKISQAKSLRENMKTIDSGHYKYLFGSKYYPEMVLVEGGIFDMGCDPGDSCSNLHKQEVSSFQMAKYETTVWQFALFCAATGKDIKKDHLVSTWTDPGDNPVVQVNWYDAVEYANWVSKQKGKKEAYIIDKTIQDPNNRSSDDGLKWTVTPNSSTGSYRLPTEAEWEYAAKGGKHQSPYKYSGHPELDIVGFVGSRTQPAGKKKANALSLYDMSGNVWEWCWDWYGGYLENPDKDYKGPETGSRRVLRGGSWGSPAAYCRVADRRTYDPDRRKDEFGFRLVFVP